MLEAFEHRIKKGILDPRQVTAEVIAGFTGYYGRRFYNEPHTSREIVD